MGLYELISLILLLTFCVVIFYIKTFICKHNWVFFKEQTYYSEGYNANKLPTYRTVTSCCSKCGNYKTTRI